MESDKELRLRISILLNHLLTVITEDYPGNVQRIEEVFKDEYLPEEYHLYFKLEDYAKFTEKEFIVYIKIVREILKLVVTTIHSKKNLTYSEQTLRYSYKVFTIPIAIKALKELNIFIK